MTPMKCPDCKERVSLDDLETDITFDASMGTVDMEGSAYFECPECGTQIKQADVSDSVDLEEEFSPIPEDHEAEYEVISDGIEIDSKEEILDQPSAPGKPNRKRKVLVWVIKGTATVRRTVVNADGEDVPDLTEEQQFKLGWEAAECDFEKCEY
jgi:hypothetical protein